MKKTFIYMALSWLIVSACATSSQHQLACNDAAKSNTQNEIYPFFDCSIDTKRNIEP